MNNKLEICLAALLLADISGNRPMVRRFTDAARRLIREKNMRSVMTRFSVKVDRRGNQDRRLQ